MLVHAIARVVPIQRRHFLILLPSKILVVSTSYFVMRGSSHCHRGLESIREWLVIEEYIRIVIARVEVHFHMLHRGKNALDFRVARPKSHQ